jgi:hypothetical protein
MFVFLDGLPFITGEKGNYRPLRSFVYLTERTQSDYNRSTNIRKDGFFTSFLPFWKQNGGRDWITPYKDSWTFASEVTLFSPYGFEMENKDALDRYTSATYGYNNALPTGVAANSQYKEMGFTGFEDVFMNTCKKEHFGFDFDTYEQNFTDLHSHTGTYSIQVSRNNKITMEKVILPCR